MCIRDRDNEAGAVEYWVCTLGDILNNHVYPFGIQKVKADARGSAFGYTVESGASQWTALYNFTKYVGNIAPVSYTHLIMGRRRVG